MPRPKYEGYLFEFARSADTTMASRRIPGKAEPHENALPVKAKGNKDENSINEGKLH